MNRICNMIPSLIEQRKKYEELKYNHMCMITTKKGVPLSYGYNAYDNKMNISEHAETMALRKLIERYNFLGIGKKVTCYMVVVRTNGGNSKPCSKCIETFLKYHHIITLKYIYYTHEDDGIIKTNFKDLINSPKHVSSYNRNINKIIAMRQVS